MFGRVGCHDGAVQVLAGGHTLLAAGACVAAAVAAAPALGRKDLPAAWRVASRVLLVGAVLAVLGATLFDTTSGERILNLQPGAGIAAAFDSSRGAFGNIAGNVALFVPLGFLWAAVSGWSSTVGFGIVLRMAGMARC